MTMRNQRYAISSIFATLGLVLSACGTQPIVLPSATQVLNTTAIPLPSMTFTPEPTATPTTDPPPTIEPTASPRELAKQFELNPERTYERRIVKGTDGREYDAVVDSFNQSPKIVFVDGAPTVLNEENQEQRELMWGHLVPKDRVYIREGIQSFNDGKKFVQAMLINLGDVSWETESFGGTEVRVPYIMVGLRDGSGELRVAKYGIDAVVGDSHYPFSYDISRWGEGFIEYVSDGVAVDVVIKNHFKPGDMYNELLGDQGKQIKVFTSKETGLEKGVTCYYELTQTLFNTKKDKMLTSEEWRMLAEGRWPEDIRYIYATYGLKQVVDVPPNPWEGR